jgi:hypothetical protein
MNDAEATDDDEPELVKLDWKAAILGGFFFAAGAKVFAALVELVSGGDDG